MYGPIAPERVRRASPTRRRIQSLCRVALALAGGGVFAVLAYAPPLSSQSKSKYLPLSTAVRSDVVTEDDAPPPLAGLRADSHDDGFVAAARSGPATATRNAFEGRTTPAVGHSVRLSRVEDDDAEPADLTADPHSRGPP